MTEILESCNKVDAAITYRQLRKHSSDSTITTFGLSIIQTDVFKLQDKLISFALLFKVDRRSRMTAL